MSISLLVVGSLLVGAGLAGLEKLSRSNPGTTPGSRSAYKRKVYESLRVGRNQFSFRFEQLGEQSWQILATQYPPITNSALSRKVTKTHVYSDGRICVTKDPKTLDQAKAIARYWATGYVAYLETGVFPNSGGSVEV